MSLVDVAFDVGGPVGPTEVGVWVQVVGVEVVPLDGHRPEADLMAGLDRHREEVDRRRTEVGGRGERPEPLGFRDVTERELGDPLLRDDDAPLGTRASAPPVVGGRRQLLAPGEQPGSVLVADVEHFVVFDRSLVASTVDRRVIVRTGTAGQCDT
jgi:hypothetical protein